MAMEAVTATTDAHLQVPIFFLVAAFINHGGAHGIGSQLKNA
jgi:hypothetical protein